MTPLADAALREPDAAVVAVLVDCAAAGVERVGNAAAGAAGGDAGGFAAPAGTEVVVVEVVVVVVAGA